MGMDIYHTLSYHIWVISKSPSWCELQGNRVTWWWSPYFLDGPVRIFQGQIPTFSYWKPDFHGQIQFFWSNPYYFNVKICKIPISHGEVPPCLGVSHGKKMGIMARRGSNFDSGPKRAAPPGSALGTPPPKDHGHPGWFEAAVYHGIWPWKIGFWDDFANLGVRLSPAKLVGWKLENWGFNQKVGIFGRNQQKWG